MGISLQKPCLGLSTATKSHIRTRSPLPTHHALTTVRTAHILGQKTTSCCPVGGYGRDFRPVDIVIFILSAHTRTGLAPLLLLLPITQSHCGNLSSDGQGFVRSGQVFCRESRPMDIVLITLTAPSGRLSLHFSSSCSSSAPLWANLSPDGQGLIRSDSFHFLMFTYLL